MSRRVARLSAVVVAILVLGGAIAAFAPLPSGPREIIYVIPKGTAAHRAAEDGPTILPARMRFTVGVRDVLVLRNDDDAPASFGPVLLAAGQTYRIPFRAPAEFQLACSFHREGAVGVVVRAEPTPGWPRFTWRLAHDLRLMNRRAAALVAFSSLGAALGTPVPAALYGARVGT